MEIANINALFKRLEAEGIDFFDHKTCKLKDHWLCPSSWGKRKKRSMLLEICSKVGMTNGIMEYFYPKKLCSCRNERCLNPACYALAKKTKIKGEASGNAISQQDMEELAEQLDLDEWKRMGTANYLEQYNMCLPPFLRITQRTFEKALEWKKGHEK